MSPKSRSIIWILAAAVVLWLALRAAKTQSTTQSSGPGWDDGMHKSPGTL